MGAGLPPSLTASGGAPCRAARSLPSERNGDCAAPASGGVRERERERERESVRWVEEALGPNCLYCAGVLALLGSGVGLGIGLGLGSGVGLGVRARVRGRGGQDHSHRQGTATAQRQRQACSV